LNHAKYRPLLSKEERREYKRLKQAEYRGKKRDSVNDMSMTVNDNVSNAHITEAEAETKKRKPPIDDATKNILRLIWESSPKISRERSSKKDLATEWQKIKTEDRPSVEELQQALAAWNLCAKWKDGYAEGIHLWVKKAQWENLPDAAQSSIKPTKTRSIYD